MKCNNPKCSKELKFESEKIIQTSERSISGFYHKECYNIIKLEKIELELS